MMIEDQVKTIITIKRHITLVQKFLVSLAKQLEKRAIEHDVSKFNEDEFFGFVQINRVAREHKYGSDEYRASLNAVEPNPIKLHYSRNSHHPEYHKNGVSDMSLIDIIEMVIDWKAASLTYGQSSLEESLEVSIKRFRLNPEQVYLVRLIVRELDES